MEKNSTDSKVDRFSGSLELNCWNEGSPSEFFTSGQSFSNFIFVGMSGIPNNNFTIFRHRNEVLSLFSGLLFINLYSIWNKLNVSNETFVRVLNITKSDMSTFNSNLLGFVSFFIGHFGDLNFAATCNNSVFRSSKIPDDDLSINTSSNNNVLFVRVEFNACDLNWGFKNVIIIDYVGISEIHDQNMS
jgi:hypothetical protein